MDEYIYYGICTFLFCVPVSISISQYDFIETMNSIIYELVMILLDLEGQFWPYYHIAVPRVNRCLNFILYFKLLLNDNKALELKSYKGEPIYIHHVIISLNTYIYVIDIQMLFYFVLIYLKDILHPLK